MDRLFSGLCQHDIQKLGLADRVRFLSDPVLMQRLLAQADIFLMTARAEAFDGDGQQAQCNGLAVVAFAGCVNAADLPGEDIALTVPYLDVEAMARAVMKLGNRPVGQRQAGAMPAPSWDHWCEGLRLILEQDFGLPPIVPVQI